MTKESNKLEIKTSAVTSRSERKSLELSREHIVALLRSIGVNIPLGAEVNFDVPGGADWSNSTIEISRETPIVVHWDKESDDIKDEHNELVHLTERKDLGK